MNMIKEKAHYAFQYIYGDTFKVIKDRFGDFKIDSITDGKTVKEYLDSGYNVAIYDLDGELYKTNF